MNALASLVARLAAASLPGTMRDWGRAMVAETETIGQPRPALRFALGCLAAAVRHRLSRQPHGEEPSMPFSLIDRPRLFAMLCAAGAVGLGLGYLALAGAPLSYFAMNGAAFALGLLALGALIEAGRIGRIAPGLIGLLLAALLLAVSLWGASADGVRRWISVGGVSLQPSLVLVPVLVLGFLRSRDRLSALAVAIAALALALQPDRAMAAALLAGLLALAFSRRGWIEIGTLAAAGLGFAVTMVRPDRSPAVPFVDQIFFSSFAVHPLAGLAVWSGAALMLLPAAIGLSRDPDHRAVHAVFGALWLAVIAAAALGNYPTPLVGYGGSAILGYLISLIGLPERSSMAGAPRDPAASRRKSQGMVRSSIA